MSDTEQPIKTGVAIPEAEADQLLYETLRSTDQKIIDEIEDLMNQVNGKLVELPTKEMPINKWNKQRHYKDQALEEIDLFQKTTLRELKKVFTGD